MLYKLSTVGSGQTYVHGLDEMLIIFEVTAQYLLCKFVSLQSALRRDLRQLRFLVGL